jgi:hypothetical protein
VGGHRPRAVRRQQQGVEAGQRQPLVVADVGGPRIAAEAQRVGQVLGELEDAAAPSLEAAAGAAPVEALTRYPSGSGTGP